MPALLLLTLFAASLAGCGQTGPLYPEPKAPQGSGADEAEREAT
jgi:predicted small lipoprotein YifL